jgi:rhodanese-related sulfurtransferase
MNQSTLLAFAAEHPIPSLALVGLTVAIAYHEISRLFAGYKSVHPAALTGLINREDALVIDLSPTGDFEKGHIPGSRNVVMSQFDPENPKLAAVKERPVAVICRTGASSAQAAKRLVKAGFKQVYWLDGGIAAWRQADLPLRKGAA